MRSAGLANGLFLASKDDLFLVLHLMIAGRLHWHPTTAVKAGRNSALPCFRFHQAACCSLKRVQRSEPHCTSFRERLSFGCLTAVEWRCSIAICLVFARPFFVRTTL